jgi:Protein of unknown function (DUF4257)
VLFLKYTGIVLLIGVVIGIWSHMDENKGEIDYPERLKKKFKSGFLYQVLTCTVAAALSVMFDVVAGVESLLAAALHATLAALAGKGFLISQVRKLELAREDALKNLQDRLNSPAPEKNNNTTQNNDKSNTAS